MAMVPHERSLVKRLESKPFVLLGIDFDETPVACRNAEEEKKITWRSWFDGRKGPIAKHWNINGLPTIYVFDAGGVIRYKGVEGQDMDEAVDSLLKEMPSAGTR